MTSRRNFTSQLLLFFAIVVSSLAGCSTRNDATVSSDKLPTNQQTNESARINDGDSQVAKRPKHGFTDYVKNPDLFRKEAQDLEMAESVSPPSPRELAELVSAIGKRQLEYEELQKLKRAGEKAAPLIETALQNDKFLFHRYGESVLDGSAIETALDLLEPFRLPDVSILERALRHPDEYFRSRALYHLAQCGHDNSIDALTAGLKSESAKCRSWTLMGLEFLKRTGRGSKIFRTALFEATVPLLGDKEFNCAKSAPRALLVFDLDRAKTVLLSPEILHPDNKSVHNTLQALKDANVDVPGPKLRNLLAGIKKKSTEYPFDYAYTEGLILLARAEGSRANDLIADAQKWGNETVKKGAAEASGIAAGVADAYGFVIDLYRQKGVKGLAEPQLFYLALFWLDAEVRNGGFSQFYFNSSGDLSPFVVKAAKAVGASDLAEIIQKANALFGKAGPNADRNIRLEQLSKVDLRAFAELDSRYYKCPEPLSELLPRFVASNPAAFKAK